MQHTSENAIHTFTKNKTEKKTIQIDQTDRHKAIYKQPFEKLTNWHLN